MERCGETKRIDRRFSPLEGTHLSNPAEFSDGERHGYTILKDVEELSAGKVVMSTGTLYEALARLLDQGSIEHVEVSQGDQKESHPGRPRKIYRLSWPGLRVLKAEANRMQSLVITTQQELGEYLYRI